jgi:amino acid transporter
MIIPAIVMTLSIAVAYVLLYAMAGRDFLIALVNFSTIGGTIIKAPLSWGGVGIAYTAMMIADNFWLQLLIIIGFICAALALVPIAWVVLTRQIFAWSFDRLIPAKFSEVNDRFHSPIWAIGLNFAIIQAGFIIFTYYSQYMGAFFTITFDVSFFAITMLCLSAACLPLRKSLWEASPAKYKLFGIPIITIGGIIGALFNGLAVFVYTFTPGVGFGLPSTEIIIAFIFTPFILYWIIKAIRKRQGIDLDLIMREIPPE